ncbi:MAG TPA: cysteine-rich CWC family protein [Pseudorhodoferax sp.]|jgi:hypothetical protein|nr:cysteine-rich CWC family protein [Pseudorhodoferax sp.]
MPSPTESTQAAVDAGRCPLCGADNRCAVQAARDQPPGGAPVDCWCMVERIAPGVLERLPAALRGRACICARCARGDAPTV